VVSTEVTGTSTGIGREATFTLAENGYRVLAGVRKQEDIDSLLAEARTRRVEGSIEPIILDVTVAGQITAAVETVRVRIAAGGRLHAIVHNAGAQWAGPIETMPLTEWRSQFDVTVFGPIALTQQLLPQLRASRGRVINVTSIGGIMPGPMIAAYQAAKAAFEAVSDSMRIEFSPFGVHVSAIAPAPRLGGQAAGDFRRRRLLRGCGLVRGFANSIALLTTSFTKLASSDSRENQRR
jgi:NAD(P)-dependent dehydrogenase (short-subunit alcohol dehydrogenase family)